MMIIPLKWRGVAVKIAETPAVEIPIARNGWAEGALNNRLDTLLVVDN
jgi:hypothetical protein